MKCEKITKIFNNTIKVPSIALLIQSHSRVQSPELVKLDIIHNNTEIAVTNKIPNYEAIDLKQDKDSQNPYIIPFNNNKYQIMKIKQ